MKNEFEDDDREGREDLRRIAGMIANLPDREPPDDVIDAVMSRIEPRKMGRLRLWWRQLQVSLTSAPLQAATAAALVVVVFAGAYAVMHKTPEQTAVTSLKQAMEGKAAVVVFTLSSPGASRVELIGSFNHWRPGNRMTWDESRKVWIVSVNLEGGRYEYAFLVDGEKVVPDPNALINQEDGFGNKNSVLIVERNSSHGTGV